MVNDMGATGGTPGVTPRRAFRRRDFLHGVGLAGLGVAGAGLLAACGADPAASGAGGAASTGGDGSLVWANWPLSIDTDDNGRIPSLEQFSKKTGIKASYVAEINSNDEWFAKIRPLLESGQGLTASVVSPTDWLAQRMIELGWAEKLDRNKIPNAGNLLPAFADPAFDPGRTHTMAWQGWICGIAVNTEVTGRDVRTVDELLTAPDLKGKTALLSEMRDTVGLLLLSMGADPGKFTDDQFNAALEKIDKALKSGQLRKFTGNDYAPDLAKGNLAACFAWAGDVVQLSKDNPKIKFFIPESGSTLGEDIMMIPAHARDPEGAHKLIDYYYDPMVAAQAAAYINAFCPVRGAQEAMTKVEPDLAENKLIFPDAAMMAMMHRFMPLSADQNQKYQDAFDRTTGL
ncbi:spermidine/putrescine ABC transporter substrate-binding protein [Streptosporangium sp. NPDC087985]|uniref:polyamine ABC transporter substrate-binding protein n=1 Tax=Streptosporangium sp. NPDC087985 TaxID=3366196 RepID=UPI0037F1A418